MADVLKLGLTLSFKSQFIKKTCCQVKLWLYVFICLEKKKQLCNLRCSIKNLRGCTMQSKLVVLQRKPLLFIVYSKSSITLRGSQYFLKFFPCYSNEITKKLIQTNYWFIYWLIKMLFNTSLWSPFGKFLHLRIFSAIETRRWWS